MCSVHGRVIFVALDIIFNILLLSMSSHIRCMTQDPGSVPQDIEPQEPLNENFQVVNCPRCETPKPREAHHCRTCQRCIIKLDHHCPWVNNCVGFLNQKHFVSFLLYTGITCLYCLVTLICRFM
eukprot:UN24608